MNDKFNFAKSPFANEIGEEMTSVNQTEEISNLPGKGKRNLQKKSVIGNRRTPRTKTEDWTLVQCRLPNDLNRRMTLYNTYNDVSKNDFIIEAVKSLLDSLGA